MRSLPALLLLVASIAACSEDDALPVFGEPVWAGEYLEVWATDDATICGGSFQALDQHAQQVSDYVTRLGVESNPDRYRYSWLSPGEFKDLGPCRDQSGACIKSGAIYAPLYSNHEIVHAEFATGHHSFVDEGLAVVLGDLLFDEAVDTIPIPEIITETQDSWLEFEYYGSAAKFVGAMEELQPELYLPPLLDTRRSDDFEAFADTVALGGVDVDAALTFNETEEECRVETFRLAVSECSLPPTPWATDAEWTSSGVLDCGSEDTIGPTGEGDIWAIRSFDIPERGKYTITAVTEGFGALVACDTPWCGTAFSGPLRPPGWKLLVSTVPTSVDLEPGRHWIRVQQKIDQDPAPFQLTVVRQSSK